MKKNGGECAMGNGTVKPEELNGQLIKETGNNYFVHGNVRIIINEHFADDGKPWLILVKDDRSYKLMYPDTYIRMIPMISVDILSVSGA